MKQSISLEVNGESYKLEVSPNRLLLDVLRDDLGLTGARRGCEDSICGACTVLLDCQAVHACSVLALRASGQRILTIEGLAQGGKLHPLQEAFIRYGGSGRHLGRTARSAAKLSRLSGWTKEPGLCRCVYKDSEHRRGDYAGAAGANAGPSQANAPSPQPRACLRPGTEACRITDLEALPEAAGRRSPLAVLRLPSESRDARWE